MWFDEIYEFEANDAEMIKIRKSMIKDKNARHISNSSCLYNYRKDSDIAFIESDKGDYIIVSGLNQHRPMVCDIQKRHKRFIDVIATDENTVDLAMKDIKGIVEGYKNLENII